jgi:hypothetical protein
VNGRDLAHKERMDCFVASAPHNDDECRHDSTSPRRQASGLCKKTFRPKRAWGMPGVSCARSPVCKGRKHTGSDRRYSRKHPAFPHAMVLTVSFVLSPVIGLSCHRRRRIKVLSVPGWADKTSADLTPASRRQDHTTSPSAKAPFVCAPRDRSRKSALRSPQARGRCRVHRIPPQRS